MPPKLAALERVQEALKRMRYVIVAGFVISMLLCAGSLIGLVRR